MTGRKKFLFEVSWEVCNKVGGIHTVIRTKLEEVKKNFGDNYCLIGPLFENNPEFYEDYHSDLINIRDRLSQAGINAKIGRWKIYGNPRVILVDFCNTLDQNKVLFHLWENYSVDSMTGGWDYIEPVLFSTMAGKVIEEVSYILKNYDISAHFHEWMTGAGLLYLKKNAPNVATVFTTHATMLGRSMSANGIDIYNILQNIEPETEAVKYNIAAKHSIESASAREADCFTTVSAITAMEAEYILRVKPAVKLLNGFNVNNIPDYYSNIEYYKDKREKLLKFASQFLMKDLDKNTIIISTSGRYEFHNKGIDTIIEALGEIHKSQNTLTKNIVMYFFIIGAFVDMSRERSRDIKEKFHKYSMISTHPLGDSYHDPIINECHKNKMQNDPDDKINIIYVPVFLNGRDGIFNMEYYEALSGCDLTIYPSYYEPWGYTPLESAAYSIPTVSSDVSGFGFWVLSNKLKKDGIKIIQRFGSGFNDSVNDLKNYILSFCEKDIDTINNMRVNIREIALNAEWEIFYKNYIEAYDAAIKSKNDRASGKEKEIPKPRTLFISGTYSQHPRLRQFSIKPSIPKRIEKLSELSYNLWWSWDIEAQKLFADLDPELFERFDNNPVALLETIDIKRLKTMASDKEYIIQYENVTGEFSKYISHHNPLLKNIKYISKERPVAYFSMEFGFHESLPLYSGGLGILSGDHIKSASDMNIPLVGIGLLYKNGYLKQRISKNGDQLTEYYYNDFYRMPLNSCNREDGEKIIISVDLPGRTLFAHVWEAKIGRVSVYFLDTDIPMNSITDREITGKLYGGGKTVRLEQEILLGIGGVRLLENDLKIYPSVYHINEGHSAFLIIERIINLMKKHNIDFDPAKEVIKASTVFTTHTPVSAGNETFDMELIENHFSHYFHNSGINIKEFIEIGHKHFSQTDPYEMTVLALKNSYKKNGVSRLHGIISREMWTDLWKGFLTEEAPILHITNGVHVPTWLSKEMNDLLIKYSSINLNEDLLKKDEWEKISHIPDEILWHTHITLKNNLFNYIKKTIVRRWEREGESPQLLEKFMKALNPSALTIGFGRRITTYKRPMLFLKDIERLKKLLLNYKYPIQFLFAGKAHPADKEVHGIIKEIVNISKREEFLGKIIFLENYNMKLSRKMVSGVDVWLNNPRRPFEASGTSGQKAGINGVINASILDGWWDEAYDGSNGWVIGNRKKYQNTETQDTHDSNSLYEILENEIIPAYFSRNSNDVPEKWIKIMKRSIISTISEYNTHRMVRDYVEKMYEPAAKRYFDIIDNKLTKAKQIVDWKKSIKTKFSTIEIKDVVIDGIYGDHLNTNDEITIYLEIYLGKVSKDELKAEMLIFQDNETIYSNGINYYSMDPVEVNNNSVKYMCKFKGDKSGKFNYGVRILPFHKDSDDIIDLNLVYWG